MLDDASPIVLPDESGHRLLQIFRIVGVSGGDPIASELLLLLGRSVGLPRNADVHRAIGAATGLGWIDRGPRSGTFVLTSLGARLLGRAER